MNGSVNIVGENGEMKFPSKEWWNEKPTDRQAKTLFGIMLFCGVGSAVIWFTILGVAVFNSMPLAYGEPLYNEEWLVYENINGAWVEVENAQITTDYTVYLGDKPYLKFEKTFTNYDLSPISEPREFGFMQSLEEFEITEPTPEPDFGVIGLMILAVSIISIVAISAKSRVVPRF